MPVPGWTNEAIESRARLYDRLAAIQADNPDYDRVGAVYRQQSGRIAAEAYFALNAAYKRYWKIDGRTTTSKVSAITAAAIAATAPFRPKTDAPPAEIEWIYLNPQFAILASYAGVPDLFDDRTVEEKRRVLKALSRLQMPSLTPLFEEGRATGGQFTSDWHLELSACELTTLDLLVAYFSALKPAGRRRSALVRRPKRARTATQARRRKRN